MAERRMFSKQIVDSDAFYDMPLSAQALYFHLNMNADDDGFLNNAKKICRQIGAKTSDYDLLLSKHFIILLENDLTVIKHWKMNNYIQSDRYRPTVYQSEYKSLTIKENKSYAWIRNGYNVSEVDTQVSIDKVSKGKTSNTLVGDLDILIAEWNLIMKGKAIPQVRIPISDVRKKHFAKCVEDNGIEVFREMMKKTVASDFCTGIKSNWAASFDWCINQTNLTKILEGNYDNNPNSFGNYGKAVEKINKNELKPGEKVHGRAL